VFHSQDAELRDMGSKRAPQEDVVQLHTLKSVLKKTALAAVALGGLLCFGGASSAQAHDRDDYGRPRAGYYDYRAHEAIERHGYYSPQADYWRHERREAFEHGWRDRYGYWHRY
jgi:hypothetical protein